VELDSAIEAALATPPAAPDAQPAAPDAPPAALAVQPIALDAPPDALAAQPDAPDDALDEEPGTDRIYDALSADTAQTDVPAPDVADAHMPTPDVADAPETDAVNTPSSDAVAPYAAGADVPDGQPSDAPSRDEPANDSPAAIELSTLEDMPTVDIDAAGDEPPSTLGDDSVLWHPDHAPLDPPMALAPTEESAALLDAENPPDHDSTTELQVEPVAHAVSDAAATGEETGSSDAVRADDVGQSVDPAPLSRAEAAAAWASLDDETEAADTGQESTAQESAGQELSLIHI